MNQALRRIGRIQDVGAWVVAVRSDTNRVVAHSETIEPPEFLDDASVARIVADGALHINSSEDGDLRIICASPLTRRMSPYAVASTTAEVVRALHGCNSEKELFQRTCDAVQAFSKFDRAMLYQFMPDFDGKVVHERCESPLPDKYLGLVFPATDIPEAARDLYAENRVRFIYDVRKPEIPIIGAKDIDLTDCVERGVARVHIEYLRNMNLAGSVSVAIQSEERLWGLLVFHYVNGLDVDVVYQKVFDAIATTFSEKLKQYRHAASEQYLRSARESFVQPKGTIDVLAYLMRIARQAKEVLGLYSVVLRANGKTLTLVGAVDERLSDAISVSESVDDFFVHSHRVTAIAAHDQTLFLIRASVCEEIRWAGDPDVPYIEGPDMLHPRKSFEAFIQNRTVSPLPWTPNQSIVIELIRGCFAAAFKTQTIQNLEEEIASVESNAIKNLGLIAGVCHEVRNAFVSIQNALESYAETGAIPDDLARGATSNIHFSLKLFNDILTMHTALSGATLTLMPTRTDLQRFFEDMKMFNTSIDVCGDAAVDVMVDPVRLKQIVFNLITNACKFGRGERIAVRWTIAKEALRPSLERYEARTNHAYRGTLPCLFISVSDRGIGMSNKFLAADLFKAFRQERTAISEKGTGLGMSIIKHLVEVMGGCVNAGSTHGYGSSFCVQIPIRVCEDERSCAARISSAWVVDDSPLNLKITSRLLARILPDATIKSFDSADEALREDGFPDLVVTDYHMEGMNGFDFIQRMNAMRTRCIMVSGTIDETVKRACVEKNVKLLEKPVKREVLETAIHER